MVVTIVNVIITLIIMMEHNVQHVRRIFPAIVVLALVQVAVVVVMVIAVLVVLLVMVM